MASRIKSWIAEHERIVSTIALVGGFVFDNLTLRRPDLLAENVVFLAYIGVSVVSLYAISLIEEGWFGGRTGARMHAWFAVVAQFCLGNLYSGFTVFYFRSSSLGASWAFILFLVLLMLANERFREKYERMVFQTTMLFLAFLSYSIFATPILVGKLGDDVFALSGVISLAAIAVYLAFVWASVPKRLARGWKGLAVAIASVLVIVSGFYAANLIPPVPLTLQDGGVYRSVERAGGDYVLIGEERTPMERLLERQTAHIVPGTTLYAYSAVYSPANISTDIVHEWQRYDASSRRWITASTVLFPIAGGRDGGYRGYSYKSALSEGSWRVNVKNKRGQVIGRISFRIEYVEADPPLVTSVGN